MTLLVDDRAGSKELAPLLTTECDLCRLDSGDVVFPGNGPHGDILVGVELKSVRDVISSSATGRLQATQVPRMLADYGAVWLLYYGVYRPSPRSGLLQLQSRSGKSWRTLKLGSRDVPYTYLEALLVDLECSGVHVKRVDTLTEAARWVEMLYKWWTKPWEKHKGMRTLDNSRAVSLLPGMDSGVHLRAKVASQLPGVGFERALAAARHFGSVAAMMGATGQEWMEVEGIGKTVAGAIVQSVNGGWEG